MGWKVIVSRSAGTDLQQIVRFIARDNPDAARRLGLRLIEKAEQLVTFPESGRIVPEFHQANIRETVHQNYRFWHAARGAPQI